MMVNPNSVGWESLIFSVDYTQKRTNKTMCFLFISWIDWKIKLDFGSIQEGIDSKFGADRFYDR